MIRAHAVITAILLSCAGSSFANGPADVFNLSGWKLQIPGPKEVKKLKGYSSGYFRLNERNEMCFILDAAEKGTTPNTTYVRSELRHQLNWKVDGNHAISATARVLSRLKPDKVTVLQIHGVTAEGDNAPPFLRIAVQKGDLYAVIKTSAGGDKTDSVLIKRGVHADFFKVAVAVTGGTLTVSVDGKERVRRDATFWKFDNYFKAGCYPQAVEGTVEVVFRELSVK